MVCYLCNDYTQECLINCRNKLCEIYFHKTCWKKYLEVNNIESSICKVCYNGKIKIKNNIQHYGEVGGCNVCSSFCNLFRN